MFDSQTISVLFLTLKYSALALFISWILALAFIYLKRGWVFSVFRFVWILPGFAYALITLSGLRFFGVEHRYSMASVLIAWVIAGVPFLALAVDRAVRDLDPRFKEVLQTLGATRFKTFIEHEVKQTLLPQGYALLQQLWLYFTSFSLVMILSGGFPNETLEVGIYTSVRLDRVDFVHALALGFWQMLILLSVRIVLSLMSEKTQSSEWSRSSFDASNEVRASKLKTFGPLLVAGATLVAAFLYAQAMKLQMDGLTSSLATSLILSFLVSISCLGFVLIFYKLKLPVLSELGAWFSPMLLTLIWWKGLAFVLLPLVNAWLVQMVLFSPWIARILVPALKRARVSEIEAAQTLGCSPLRAWISVEWPRLRPVIIFCLTLVFALSLSEVTAVLLFSQADFLPVSVWIQNAFLSFRLDEAFVGTLVLISVSYGILSLSRERS